MTKREKYAWEIHNWQRGGATNFTCQLFSLFCKADIENRRKLANSFPEQASVWAEWYDSPNPNMFYKKYDIPHEELSGIEA